MHYNNNNTFIAYSVFSNDLLDLVLYMCCWLLKTECPGRKPKNRFIFKVIFKHFSHVSTSVFCKYCIHSRIAGETPRNTHIFRRTVQRNWCLVYFNKTPVHRYSSICDTVGLGLRRVSTLSYEASTLYFRDLWNYIIVNLHYTHNIHSNMHRSVCVYNIHSNMHRSVCVYNIHSNMHRSVCVCVCVCVCVFANAVL